MLSACAAYDRAPAESAADERERPLIHALQVEGVEYRLGGRSPETGFDCGGLVVYAFERAWGVSLPMGTRALRRVGQPVSAKDLKGASW